ncbi:MAG: SIR2 family NAD-dependent protein deacylase [Nevskiales bacterium]
MRSALNSLRRPLSGNSEYRASLDQVVDRLHVARRILVITGAGISADSGLPTYRGIGGLYEDTMTGDKVPIEVALSGEMMRLEPQLTWKYIHQIESACRGARFNEAHRIIAAMQDRFETVCVLTQNIDGFHRDAGSRNLIEIHGNIHELHCVQCDYDAWVVDYSAIEIPPRCPHCGALVRPRVVLFGEMLPEAALEALYQQFQRGFDAVLSIGTTSVFPYIAAPVHEARRAGIPTIEINPGDSEVSELVDHRLKTRAVVAMENIWKRL